MEDTAINWADHTHSEWKGCTEVDRECVNCYARILLDDRYGANSESKLWGKGGVRERVSEETRRNPYKWNRRAEANGRQEFVFCGSVMDVMDDHPSIKCEWRESLFRTIRETPWLTWLLLTKRPENFSVFMPDEPLRNVWLGTTCGHAGVKGQKRVEALRAAPVAPGCHRFISAEPLLEDISGLDFTGISWIITGGESGQGKSIRRFDLDHAMNLYKRCRKDSISFWFKQVGTKTVGEGELLDLASSLHDLYQVPDAYREMLVRERPEPVKVEL